MGRPKKDTVIYSVRLSLTPGEDDDLIAFLAAAPERGRALAVKAAMRGGNLGSVDDNGDDAALLAALEDFLI